MAWVFTNQNPFGALSKPRNRPDYLDLIMISETKNTGGPLELEVEREQFNLEIRKRHRG